MIRLAILASHPVQYYAPLFRALAEQLDLTVFYAHRATVQDQAQSGFGLEFAWDVDLLSGYHHVFLTNVARQPQVERFWGVDTPEIGWRLREHHFDALLLMGWYLKCFIQGPVAAKRLGLPVMVRGDSHLDTPRSMLKLVIKHAVYPHFLRRFDAALVVGKRNRAYWEHYSYPRDRMFDAPHCVDNVFFSRRATLVARMALRTRLGIAPNARVVLFAGKLVAVKRPLDVIEGVARARERGLEAELLVAGTGPLEEAMRMRANQLGVSLHLLGFCNQTEMPSAYAAADLLVMTSESETWGLVVNEALASGTPVLLSDAVGCAPDIAELLGSRTVFGVGRIDDLADKLRNALSAQPPRETIKAAAAQFDLAAVATGIAQAAKWLNSRQQVKLA